MSSDEPDRSVPDELFRKVSARPERQLPDALFGGPPAAAADPVAEDETSAAKGRPRSAAEEAPSVPDELFKQKVSAKAERQLPDLLFGGPFPSSPVAVSGSEDEEAESDAEASAAEPVAAREIESDGVGESRVAEASVDSAGREAAADPVSATESAQDSVAADAAEDLGGAGAGVADSTGAAAEVGPAGTDDALGADPDSLSTGADAAADPGAAEESEANAVVLDEVAERNPGAAATAVNVPSADGQAGDPAADTAVTGEAARDAGEQTGAPDAGVTAASLSQVAAAEPAPVPADNAQRPVLIVIADSLAYFGPKGGLPADHPRIWPNLVGAELDWDVELVGRIGWTSRDAYWALIGDPRIWAAVPKASAVVFAVGGMDTLPSPLPTALRELIRYIRPPGLRRVVRNVYNWCQPKLSKLGRPVALPPRLSVDYLEQSRQAITQLRPDLPVVAVLPSVHNCDAYGRVHSGRPRAEKALRAWSEKTSVPLVDLAEAVRENIFSGEANPDGIHWGWDGHTAVANAMVKTLQEVR